MVAEQKNGAVPKVGQLTDELAQFIEKKQKKAVQGVIPESPF
ncbi:hypothetical protein DFQ01_1451 [Paenibacillus cellulosilyticus]|uniref:Uncharacterized protein n=1 Tax=Paenibacillus cellulosilyticus TaxID=375489 RepID=A0A2V2YC69_9BACL|nr:hypothetical protein DFQ01_1451 [Paenibacillus cellulosilyticus]